MMRYIYQMDILKDKERWREAVRKIITFRYLEDTELDHILASGDILEYDGEEPIIEEGQVDQSVFGVLSGTVCVNVQENDGGTFLFAPLGLEKFSAKLAFFLK